MNAYLEKEVLPIFKQWTDSMSTVVSMKDAKKYGRFFIANYIDPVKAGSRGAIYDLFEDLEEYAGVHSLIYAGKIPEPEHIKLKNFETLAKGIVWAMEHDGFDSVKYDPIQTFGPDISMYHGKKEI